ncbi:cbb3-type cytochrome c oxidase N-terminal domain-containing protein [Chryseobacterium potabilaquae]|uniref:Cbb3-type cytochrome c oxidase subunit CcoP2 n=1 Tax=Chryseobacterium potabilaquae TaxID=2675057 RepID=A0A6N4XDS4_9FLAO|nr:cbb3-type cytochrome c oxidase N-terminal domain-containing protein [Chryseobacterium potabilaquae]CAA7197147.1 Cbb3-type cytochrome c oxidase subunit CcoP2 [Chryseobacterium potabilaquae]
MKTRTPISVHIAITIGLTIMAFEMFAHDSDYFSSPFFWALLLITIILLFIMNSIGDLVENERFNRLSEEEKKQYLKEKNVSYLQKLWNSAFKKQSETEEKDILIDHGFDGITELDNSLPKWWIGLFWFGCIFCVIYLLAFSFTDYAHPDKEYDHETKTMLASINEYEKNAPQINLETAKYNADHIAEGEELFKTNCVTCHGEKGKGGIGPNLTDTHWINIKEKSLFKNVFWMLENGSPNNPAMRPFIKEGTITGRDAEKIAAYVYHINQEVAPITPVHGGAAPQGQDIKWENGND